MKLKSWALPLVAVALCGGCGSDSASAPDKPTVDSVAALTNQNPLTVSGSGEPGATVEVRGGADAVASAPVDSAGQFSVDVKLVADAENTLLISQRSDGGESEAVKIVVTHDGTPPDAPKLGPVASLTNEPKVTISGSAEAKAAITITGGAQDASTSADDRGQFSLEVKLDTSLNDRVKNDLAIVATDAAGNDSAAANVTITFDPNLSVAPPTLDPVPSPTHQIKITLTGVAPANAQISVAGGAKPATASADSSGKLSIEVQLSPNTTNKLFAFAALAGKTSPPTELVVVHDDIAPPKPSLDPVASPTGAASITLSGQTEANATIDISGGAQSATAQAKADGSFSASVKLTADATNTLSVTAKDEAGNASAAATLKVKQDSSLPTPVVVDPLASPTNQNPITVSGTSQPNADIDISGGAQPVSVKADSAGKFSAQVTLSANASNELHVSRASSGVETVVVVVHDDKAPAVPTLTPIASPTGSTSLVISGQSEPGAQIAITGGSAAVKTTVRSDKQFSATVTIAADKTSTLAVVASDKAGNTSAPSTLQVTHSSSTPAAPQLDDPNPAPTQSTSYTLKGRVPSAAPGTTVTVSGDASASGSADDSTGIFSVKLTLAANQVNTLEVTYTQGTLVSAKATVNVTHDNVAPAAPDQSKISVGSGALLCSFRGSIVVSGAAGTVEAGATVHVANTTATQHESTTTADDQGAFSTTITVCKGDTLSLTATDGAANVSAATTLAVP